MNYFDFLDSLEESGFEKLGKSGAFKISDGWIIGFIGLSGRMQKKDSKAFVICARPEKFKYMDAPKNKFSSEPMEYPFKLTLESSFENLQYKSQLLRFDYSRIDIESDWSELLNLLVSDFPQALSKLGVSRLEAQLRNLKDLGFIEKMWIKEECA